MFSFSIDRESSSQLTDWYFSEGWLNSTRACGGPYRRRPVPALQRALPHAGSGLGGFPPKKDDATWENLGKCEDRYHLEHPGNTQLYLFWGSHESWCWDMFMLAWTTIFQTLQDVFLFDKRPMSGYCFSSKPLIADFHVETSFGCGNSKPGTSCTQHCLGKSQQLSNDFSDDGWLVGKILPRVADSKV